MFSRDRRSKAKKLHRELSCAKAPRQEGATHIEGAGGYPGDLGHGAEKIGNRWKAGGIEVTRQGPGWWQ